jgi:hypothetical protein
VLEGATVDEVWLVVVVMDKMVSTLELAYLAHMLPQQNYEGSDWQSKNGQLLNWLLWDH